MTKETVYCGERLFRYLDQLKSNIAEAITEVDTFTNLTHTQLSLLIEAEKNYLTNHRPTQDLAFTQHGLPSVDSLTADLETMCQLEEFKEIAQRYKQTQTDTHYKEVTETEWKKQKEKHKDTTQKTQFTIKETKDRQLQLILTEETYLDRPDEHSQNHPVLTRQATTTYRTQWDELLYYTDEKYFTAGRQQAALTTIDNKTLIPYRALEELVESHNNSFERYKKMSDIYDYGLDKQHIRNLKTLSDASIINKTDQENYTSAIKRIDRAFNRELKDFYTWSEIKGKQSQAGIAVTVGLMSLGVLSSIAVGGVLGFTLWVESALAGLGLGNETRKIMKKRLTETAYKKAVAKHMQRHQTINTDIDLALDTARSLQTQLQNPKYINAKYKDRFEIAGIRKQTQEYLKEAISILDRLRSK